MVGLQRPNEHLSRVKTVWDNLSEAEQEAYAAEIERIAATNKQKLVEKRKREKPVKTPPISRAAKPFFFFFFFQPTSHCASKSMQPSNVLIESAGRQVSTSLLGSAVKPLLIFFF